MRAKLTLCSALALVLMSATAGFAQTMQYDRTGDHMASYGPAYNSGRTTPIARQQPVHAPAHTATPIIDRTGDHMLYYGPIQ
jgi:hypothetical protein